MRREQCPPNLGTKCLVFRFQPKDVSLDDTTGELKLVVPVFPLPTVIRTTLQEIGMKKPGVHAVLDLVDQVLTMQYLDDHRVRD
jgi:hypothetical protein